METHNQKQDRINSATEEVGRKIEREKISSRRKKIPNPVAWCAEFVLLGIFKHQAHSTWSLLLAIQNCFERDHILTVKPSGFFKLQEILVLLNLGSFQKECKSILSQISMETNLQNLVAGKN